MCCWIDPAYSICPIGCVSGSSLGEPDSAIWTGGDTELQRRCSLWDGVFSNGMCRWVDPAYFIAIRFNEPESVIRPIVIPSGPLFEVGTTYSLIDPAQSD